MISLFNNEIMWIHTSSPTHIIYTLTLPWQQWGNGISVVWAAFHMNYLIYTYTHTQHTQHIHNTNALTYLFFSISLCEDLQRDKKHIKLWLTREERERERERRGGSAWVYIGRQNRKPKNRFCKSKCILMPQACSWAKTFLEFCFWGQTFRFCMMKPPVNIVTVTRNNRQEQE